MIKPKKHIAEMSPYNPPLEGRSGFKYRFDFNESTLGCSPEVIKDIQEFLSKNNLNVYPEYGKLAEIAASFFEVDEGQIMITNGSDQGIDVLIRTYVGKGDEVIIPTPSFAMFYQSAKIEGAKIQEILYNEDLSFPTTQILEAINPNTKLVIICNPNNPTGTRASPEDIKKIVEKAENIPVYIDETYYDFSRETALELMKKHDNIIITRTFSKAFGLAALRIGFLFSNEQNIKEMLKVRGPYDMNMIAKTATISAIKHSGFVKEYCEEVMEESKPYLYEELEKMGLKTFPSSANFLIVKIGQRVKEITEKLAEKGILVRDRSKYPLLEGCIRVSIGNMEYTRHFVKVLRGVLND
jgi:histidinol-phosphate aminotransferase